VPIDEDELKAVEIESNHTVDITGFVPKVDIDKRYLDKPYYVTPLSRVLVAGATDGRKVMRGFP